MIQMTKMTTMNSSSSPWDEIATPADDFNVRQVPDGTAVPCYWAKDPAGACLFVIDLEGDHTREYKSSIQPVHGIDVDLRSGRKGTQRLVLTLHSHTDRDLFAGLCRTLAIALERATDSSTSLAVALAHIGRWKAFLSGRSHRLSPEEIQGLFAELSFLIELIDRSKHALRAVEAWRGPERSHQDFIFGNTAVEIKSITGTERSTVRISSEDQLESLQSGLYLRIYRLSAFPDDASARSLNDRVAAVRQRLNDGQALDIFNRLLDKHKYAVLPAYDQPKFLVKEVRTYRVEREFPRIARAQLPKGVARVTYDLQLESIHPHVCESDEVFRDI